MRLETERLILRVPEQSDVDAWTEMYAQPDVQRFLKARPRERVVEYISEIRARHEVDGYGGAVEIGWALHPDARSHGYATEASAVCRDYVLERIRPRVIALIDPENERSIRVAERLGLAHERNVLQNGSKTMRLYALEQDRA